METLFSAFSPFGFFRPLFPFHEEECDLNATSPLFTGCAAALITPFRPDNKLDLGALERLIEKQVEAGTDALVLLGTTGEPCTLSMHERELVIKTGVKAINGAMPVIVGTGANDTSRACEYARQAESLGAQGQLCVTPYYNKATQAGLVRHFSKIADSSDLPLILYNVPSRTGVSLSSETAAVLAEHPKIAGIKEASGNAALASDIILRAGKHLPVYCGNDDMILPLMALGAKGAISVCANVLPAKTKELTYACLCGELEKARALQLELLPLIHALFAQVNPIPVKAALSMMKLCADVLRLPLTPLEEPYRTHMRDILISMNLI